MKVPMPMDSIRGIERHPGRSLNSNPCRLLYVVGQLGLGGLERQLFYLVHSMDRMRYKPAVVVWHHSHDDYYVREILALGVPVIPLESHLSRSAKLSALRSLVTSMRPEVVHSYSFYTNLAAWWAARGTRVIPIGSIRNNFAFELRQAGKVLGRLCGRWPVAQISNSLAAEEAAKHCSALFRPRRIYVIQNGVDLDKFSPQCHPQRGYILAVGNLYPRKRWDRLIRAIALLPANIVCPEVRHVGSGPLREELEAMTKDLHVEHVFQFLGARHDIPALLADAAFLVHVAEDEGCPNVVLEAMACGRAVIAMEAGDIPYLVEEGHTGFVVRQNDEVALADRIGLLLNDESLCRRMGQAARAKAERDFSLQRLVVETLNVYKTAGWTDSTI